MRRVLAAALAFTGPSLIPLAAQAQAAAPADGRVVYEAAFFQSFAPQTALDMVRRVPGFSLAEGAERRGFSGAAGNVLIDGERPSSKTELEDLLARIPAAQVLRIELLRGAAAAGDAPGQAVLVNVVRTSSAGTGTWQIDAQRSRKGRVMPGGNFSWAGRAGQTEYGLGGDYFSEMISLAGFRRITDADDNLLGTRRDVTPRTYREFALNGEVRRPVLGSRLNLNANWFEWRFYTGLGSEGFAGEVDETPLTDSFFVVVKENERKAEFGGDYERAFGPVTAKVLGLTTRRRFEAYTADANYTAAGGFVGGGEQARRNDINETIVRGTLTFSPVTGHRIETGAEGAFNSLESQLTLTLDTGSGPVEQDLAFANVTVEETRGEAFITDFWQVTDKWAVEAGIAVEKSTLTQSGDSSLETKLTYWKPSLQISRKFGARDQARVKFFRDVGQLDFQDFVSFVDLNDDRVIGGNPNLRPDATWRLEAGLDKRFGDSGALNLTLFRGWVEDVSDLIPIEGVDAPGNIGDGDLTGATIKTTIPLKALLPGAQLTADLTLQEYEVSDPVTGAARPATEFNETIYKVEFRQDLPARKFAWGWTLTKNSEIQFYRLHEVETYEEGALLEVFAETRVLRGLKTKLNITNALDRDFDRQRVFYDPDRAGAVDFIERRSRENGHIFGVELSGTL